MEEEFSPTAFWKEYTSLDLLGKEQKVQQIVQNIDGLHSVNNDNLRKHALTNLMISYFDDLIEYMEFCDPNKDRPEDHP